MEGSSLKEMYDMGERLCQMAKDMGYSPESDDEEEMGEDSMMDESEGEETPMPKAGKNNLKLALGFLK